MDRKRLDGVRKVGPPAEAARRIDDYFSNSPTSIARPIANNLQRGVEAYDVGLYFSPYDAHDDPDRTAIGRSGPSILPVYMVPVGVPHHKPGPIGFAAQ